MPPINYQPSTWMRDLNAIIGDVPLSRVKMPGTHNAGAFSIDFFKRVKCQDRSIGDQLYLGARYLDIRLTKIISTICMHHNGITSLVQTFENALQQIANYLNSHTRELVIINLSRNKGSALEDSDVHELHRLIEKYLSPYIYRNIPEHTKLMRTDQFTLNNVVCRDKLSTNQVIISVPWGDGAIGKLIEEKGSSQLYWSLGIAGTWRQDIYTRNGKFEQQLKEFADYLPQAIRARKPSEHDFFIADSYLYNQKNSIHEMGIYTQDRFRNIANIYDSSVITNINIVIFDFFHDIPAMDVIDLNLKSVVTIYSNEGFRGRQLRLAERNYTYTDLNSRSFNDQISSIRVAPGYRITVYEHENYCGNSRIYRSDTSHLNDFNNRISSICVEKDTELVAQVTESAGFTGRGWDVSCGAYFQCILMQRGMHDGIESVRVKSGYRVTLFADYFYRGDKVVYRSDCGQLGSMANRASCMVVEKDDPVAATLYDNDNYQGRDWQLSCGRYDGQWLVDRYFEKCISSARLQPGYRITFFSGANFTGSSSTYTSETPNVGALRGKICSIILEKN